MKRVNYYLSEEQIENLKFLAVETDLSISEHIRRAIDMYLQEQKDVQNIRRSVLEKSKHSRRI